MNQFIPPFACGDLLTSLIVALVAVAFFASVDWFVDRNEKERDK